MPFRRRISHFRRSGHPPGPFSANSPRGKSRRLLACRNYCYSLCIKCLWSILLTKGRGRVHILIICSSKSPILYLSNFSAENFPAFFDDFQKSRVHLNGNWIPSGIQFASLWVKSRQIHWLKNQINPACLPTPLSSIRPSFSSESLPIPRFWSSASIEKDDSVRLPSVAIDAVPFQRRGQTRI